MAVVVCVGWVLFLKLVEEGKCEEESRENERVEGTKMKEKIQRAS